MRSQDLVTAKLADGEHDVPPVGERAGLLGAEAAFPIGNEGFGISPAIPVRVVGDWDTVVANGAHLGQGQVWTAAIVERESFRRPAWAILVTVRRGDSGRLFDRAVSRMKNGEVRAFRVTRSLRCLPCGAEQRDREGAADQA